MKRGRPSERGERPRKAKPVRPAKPARPRPEPAARAPREGATETLFGLRAGLAIFERRRGDIVRVAVAPEVRDRVTELVRWARSSGVSVSELGERELERIAETKQHEGLCMEVRARSWMPPSELADVLVAKRGAAIALDRVRNPYNIGAILRTAAFFGIEGAILGAPAPHPALAPSAVRVAEGGAEHLALSRTTDLADTLGRLRARGIRVIGAENDAQHDAVGYRFERPAVLVLGHEREGLGPRVRAQCDDVVAIRGRGGIHSLNVAVAASLMVAELVRSAT